MAKCYKCAGNKPLSTVTLRMLSVKCVDCTEPITMPNQMTYPMQSDIFFSLPESFVVYMINQLKHQIEFLTDEDFAYYRDRYT